MAECNMCGALTEGSANLCPQCQTGVQDTQAEQSLHTGYNFNGLEILQKIGRGGMGVVYKARQPLLDRLVAVKVLLPSFSQNAEFAQRFTREARALASLIHPNIVTVHDFGKENEQFFLVMEYVDGTSLRPLLKNKKLPVSEALRIIPALCDALEYAHSKGVVHRDIKPENILIDQNGRVKIADFGLAKLLGQEQTPESMTRTNAAMGTPQYMAPEQYESAKTVDHRADIYSMGVLFYEMLTGDLPLGHFPPPSSRATVDKRLDAVVLRALHREPEKRYQSMSDVRRDVTQLSIPIAAPPKSAIPALFAGAAVFAAFAGLAIWLNGGGSKTPAPAVLPAPAAAAAAMPNPSPATQNTPPAAPAPADPWDLATLKESEVPAGWKVQESMQSESRRDAVKTANFWGMAEQVDGIDHVRRITLGNPQDMKIEFFAYSCRDRKTIDNCLIILEQRYLPRPNRCVVDKGNLFVVVSASDTDGHLAPAVEQIEDCLRVKLGLSPVQRADRSLLRADHLPEHWTELTAQHPPLIATEQADIAKLLESIGKYEKPKPEDMRSAWIRYYGDPQKENTTVKVVSLRFFELDPAKEFMRLADGSLPIDADVCILRERERVVIVSLSPRHNPPMPAFEKLAAEISKSLGTADQELRNDK